MSSTKIFKLLPKDFISKLIANSAIFLSEHALKRLNQSQRKLYKDEDLINIIRREKPVLIGVQGNGLIACFYRKKDDYLRIILSLRKRKITIITFMITKWLPQLK